MKCLLRFPCLLGLKMERMEVLNVALNALEAVAVPHHFLGINAQGQMGVVRAKGNKYGHIILRGGSNGHNYDSVSIREVEGRLAAKKMREAIVIDCSHANSNKDYRLQPLVMENAVNQILEGNHSITGLMVESNIHEGNQKLDRDLSKIEIWGQCYRCLCKF